MEAETNAPTQGQTISKKTTFQYNERITVGIRASDASQDIQLETVSIFSPSSVTPIPIHKNLVQLQTLGGARRILIQTGSSPSQSIKEEDFSKETANQTDNNIERIMGPSGVSIKVWFPHDNNNNNNNNKEKSAIEERENHFESILRYLHAQRIVVAPLDSVRQSRLHRWIYTKFEKESNLIQLQLILPVQGSPMSSEGMYAFTEALPCGRNSGILAGDVAAMSSRLLGNQDTPSTNRRSKWIDINFEEDFTHDLMIRVHRGMQYSAVFPNNSGKAPKALPLSDILPGHSTKPCPFSSSTVLETIHLGSFRSHTQELKHYQDWSTILVPFTPSEKASTRIKQDEDVIRFYRKIHRRHGIANSGTLITMLENRHDSISVEVNITDIFPNIVKPKWHTLRFESNQQSLSPLMSWNEDGSTQMYLHTVIRANSTFQVSVDYDPVLLAFQQFPGDPNRGIELPPSIATMRPFLMEDGQQQQCDGDPSSATQQCHQDSFKSFELVSNTLLLMPPVPDMSMPFNVNSLASTFYAFIFGTCLNLLIRKSTQKIGDQYKESKKSKTAEETPALSSDPLK